MAPPPIQLAAPRLGFLDSSKINEEFLGKHRRYIERVSRNDASFLK